MTKLNISEQCRRAGIDRKTYYYRLSKGVEDLFAPPTKRHRRSVPNHIKPILKENGICNSMYFARLDRGWTEFEASHVLPNSFIAYYHNGKTISSQLSRSKYWQFLNYVNEKGLTPEEAFERVSKGGRNA